MKAKFERTTNTTITLAKTKKKATETPLMKQYYGIKAKHPDAILLFRVGDFYETFSDDAIKASEILGITLTRRANGSAAYIELAGFPHHSLDTYLPKLVRAGQRVAVCEQLEDPKSVKGIVKRGITELVTPGVSTNANVLENKENNFVASVHIDKKRAGIAFLDISTGEFLTAEGNFDYIDKLLSSFAPKEVLYERSKKEMFELQFGTKFYTSKLDDWAFHYDAAYEKLLHQFDVKSLKGYGIEQLNLGVIASGSILHYLDITHHNKIQHITSLARIEEDKYVWLDKFTVRNLELLHPLNEGGQSLVNVLDKTVSPMGARMLKRWIALPLKEERAINNRLNVVGYVMQNTEFRNEIEEKIHQIGDLERIISRVALARINPREVIQLKNALNAIAPIKQACEQAQDSMLRKIGEQLNPCISMRERIEKEIHSDPPTNVLKGKVIADGVNEELDELRKIAYSGKDFLAEVQQRESERTGISSLKISFNNVFGYYFEVRNIHKDKVPEEWVRKQTLVNAERYINDELKQLETKILGAEEKILTLETRLFSELVFALADYIPAIQLNANLISQLDVLHSFAQVSIANKYARPTVNDSKELNIKEGRHPVIEQQLPIDEEYISNNVLLNNKDQQIIIITGPNMAGKSALLRQTALIVLMAQMGCYVPAKGADIGYVDKVFTRVGASDNISLGESTFMVEMQEASSILNNLSDRSLVLFDELGRGTSTYDGISIAWAIVEFIQQNKKAKAKTLFATHYHELNEMENSFKGIKNFNVSVKELNNKVIFLRKLVRGGSEHSFGIHVARMAGMPKSVVKRADGILEELEKSREKQDINDTAKELANQQEGMQLSFFQLDDPTLAAVKKQIQNIDINNLTPVEALNKLNEIKKMVGAK